MTRTLLLALCSLAALTACKGSQDIVDSAPVEVGVPALGGGAHTRTAVNLDLIGGVSDGLNTPRDLAFNPEVEGELWVVNRRDDSTVTFFDVGTDAQTALHIVDPYALHFMDNVSSIAFGKPGHFGTCQESRNTYNGQGPVNEFMGPTLWSSDFAIYGESNPEAVEYLTQLYGFYTDLGSHLDMLHESPLCMGIAWESENVYWVFDGYHSSIVRYDFVQDHGPGWDDHSDGIIGRYVEGEVAREADVPSHVAFDPETGLLYIADTGNARIAVLDTNTGERSGRLQVQEPGTDHYSMDGATLTTLVDGASVQPSPLLHPSGLTLVDGLLLVGDVESSFIYAFDLEGNMVDYLGTGVPAGGLMGIEARSLSEIFFVNAEDNQVLRLTPLE
ncbi:MAG: hypothetical protein H6741_24105 [Alphaproteobacteria bacterium]|nr:hypothetical protein [Alphaproteobacteria bacterium]MCB9795791.1 hypothetical protein [Alphaproteobacteria bacterium]